MKEKLINFVEVGGTILLAMCVGAGGIMVFIFCIRAIVALLGGPPI